MKYTPLIALLLLGCNSNEDEHALKPVEGMVLPSYSMEFKTQPMPVTYDGCQYLVLENGKQSEHSYALAFTHRGNCTNKIHRHWNFDQ